jgi:hypothetical protein
VKHFTLAVVWFLVGTVGSRFFLLNCGGSEFTEDEQGGAPGAPEQGGTLGLGGALREQGGAPEQGGALGLGGALEREGWSTTDARCTVGSCQDPELAATRLNQVSSCERSCAEPESATCPDECEAILALPPLPCSVACLDCRDECASVFTTCVDGCGVSGDAYNCRQSCQTSSQACQKACEP